MKVSHNYTYCTDNIYQLKNFGLKKEKSESKNVMESKETDLYFRGIKVIKKNFISGI